MNITLDHGSFIWFVNWNISSKQKKERKIERDLTKAFKLALIYKQTNKQKRVLTKTCYEQREQAI